MSLAASELDRVLWPFVQHVVDTWALPGLAVGLVHDGDQTLARGFGTRARGTDEPVTGDTLFHLASVSKTFVATAVLQLVERGDLDLEGNLTAYLPDLPWTDPRARAVTLRQVLSHRSGLGDVSDYGWHEPEYDEGSLARFAARVAGWSLEREPGAAFAYSNAAYEVLGHLVATVGGRSFERHQAERVLAPVGMTTSTFLRREVPAHLAAEPHLGPTPRVLAGAYPYTRQHAPSSSLHSSAAELGRWMAAHLNGGRGLMSRATHEVMWEPQAETGWGDLHEQVALGWFRGTHRDQVLVGHAGADPGFQTNLALLPEAGAGAVVLVNGNTGPVFGLTRAVLDVLLGREPQEPPLPPVTVPLVPVLEAEGPAAAVEVYHRLATTDPPTHDLDDEYFEDAVWGVIEMHHTGLARPLLGVWQQVRPESSAAWFMTGWADAVDGHHESAVEHLRHAVDLDPDHDDAVTMLRRLTGDDPSR